MSRRLLRYIMNVIVRPASIRFSLCISDALALSACLTLLALPARAVACAAKAVKDLRTASMNFANLNPFASSLTAFSAPAGRVDKSCYCRSETLVSNLNQATRTRGEFARP